MELLESIEIVALRLEPIDIPFAFLGGAAVCLLVDNPELMDFRPTKDVDIIIKVTTPFEMAKLDERLRKHGFQHDMGKGAPICRWEIGSCKVDIMPIDQKVLGMNSRWLAEALNTAREKTIAKNISVKVVTPPYFLATKLEAFKDRGNGDFYGSPDIEDMVTLIDGCASMVDEVGKSSNVLRRYLADAFTNIIQAPNFNDAFAGHFPADLASRQRIPMVLERIRAIANQG